MNKHQLEHIAGECNVYKPIEAHKEEWVHIEDKEGNFAKAYPKPETRRRQDLPSLSEQWRQEWKKRCEARRKLNEQGSSNR